MPNLTLQLAPCTTASPVATSSRVLRLAAMFGLPADRPHTRTVVPPIALAVAPGQIVFITGPSGAGKSMLLRAVRRALRRTAGVQLVTLSPNHVRRSSLALIDRIDQPLDQAVRCLSIAGLSDVAAMLQNPATLSTGQRYRWALAQALATASTAAPATVPVILADEFCSTLDRLTATVLAHNTRKWITRHRACLIAASAHDDLLDHLQPDTVVTLDLAGRAAITQLENEPRPSGSGRQELRGRTPHRPLRDARGSSRTPFAE